MPRKRFHVYNEHIDFIMKPTMSSLIALIVPNRNFERRNKSSHNRKMKFIYFYVRILE